MMPAAAAHPPPAVAGQGSLRLADDEFFSAPFKHRDELLAHRQEALLVDAPRSVSLEARTTLPLAVLQVASFAQANQMPFDRFALVVAADPETGRVRVGRAVTPSPKLEPPRPPPPGGQPAGGVHSSAQVIDVRQQAGVPWRPARLILSLILAGQISPQLQVRLEGPEKEPEGEPLPARTPAKADAAAPREPGLRLTAEPRARLHGEGPLTVRGSFKVKLPPDATQAPLTLLITGSVAPVPFVWDLSVPVAHREASMASGGFTVNLDDAGTVRSIAQTLFVYGFCGDQRFGPLSIALEE
jgi:hypothetical protein